METLKRIRRKRIKERYLLLKNNNLKNSLWVRVSVCGRCIGVSHNTSQEFSIYDTEKKFDMMR